MEAISSTSSSDRPFREALSSSYRAVLATALLLAPVAWWANRRFGELMPGSTIEHRIFADIASAQVYDAVIVGTSRAQSGVDPTAFGGDGNYYNVALAASPPRIQRMVVEYFLARGNKARCALIEVNSWTFDPRHVWRRPYHTASAMGRDEALRLHDLAYGRDPLEEYRIVLNSTPLWRDRPAPERLMFGIDWYDPIRARRQPYDARGFRRGYVPLPDNGGPPGPKVKQMKTPRFQVHPAEVAALEAIVNRLRASGSTVILFRTPTCLWTEVGDARDQAEAEVQRIVRTYDLPFLDYQNASPPSVTQDRKECFWDWQHLCDSGAILFSKELWRDATERLNGLAAIPKSPAASAGVERQ